MWAIFHQMTFEAVLAHLQGNREKETYNQENKTLHCNKNKENQEKSGENEVFDVCNESQTTTSDHWKAEPSKR